MKKECSETKIRIHESALRLFMEKGFDDTSINQIMRDSHMAKGTFYLYYKDKATLIQEVIITENVRVLEALIQEAYDVSIQKQLSWQNAFIKRLIQHHCAHPQILRLITHSIHNLSTQIMKERILDNVYRLPEFLESIRQSDEDARIVMNRFILILEITGIVCYNAIYHQHPDDITQIEDLLYQHLCSNETGEAS